MKKILFAAIYAGSLIFATSCNSEKKNDDKNTGDSSAIVSENISDTSAFSVGSYTGTIPVGESGSKAQVSISFNADSTFTMKEIQLNKEGKSEIEMANEGTWAQNKESKRVYLKYKNLADRITSFTVINDKTIQMHSGSMETKETSGEAYNLTKE